MAKAPPFPPKASGFGKPKMAPAMPEKSMAMPLKKGKKGAC